MVGDELARFRRIAHERFGVVLPENAESFLRSRLRDLITEPTFGSLDDVLRTARVDGRDDLLLDIIEKVSTNHSYFYREPAHFEFLNSTALPEIEQRLRKDGSRDLRVWSAAAAAGEEAYSIVMAMRAHFGPHYQDLDAGVLATDIAKSALRRGANGVYEEEAFRHMPAPWRSQFLEPAGEGFLRVTKAIRDEVMFRWLNLNGPLDTLRGGFHIIFCRNVMIYFDDATRDRLVGELARLLAPGGYLFIGHTDNAEPARRHLDPVQTAIFRKRTA